MSYGLVSIVMPNYNANKYVEETIKSVINQTYSDWEILFVDDCSKDNSVELVRAFKDERIKIFVNESNKGAAYSRNYALRHAKGKWIAFLDSDDMWHPQKLEKQLEFMVKNNYKFSCTRHEIVNESGERLHIEYTAPKKITHFRMCLFDYVGCLTVMYDAKEIGLIQISEGILKRNDYALFIKASKKAICYYLDENLASYRKRNGSISNVSKFELMRHHYNMHKKSGVKSSVVAVLLTLVNTIFWFEKRLLYIKKVDY